MSTSGNRPGVCKEISYADVAQDNLGQFSSHSVWVSFLRSGLNPSRVFFCLPPAMPHIPDGLPPLLLRLKELDSGLESVTRELRSIRKRHSRSRKLPPQVLTASKVLVSRTGNMSFLLPFLKWKTGRDKNDLDRWAGDMAVWYRGAGDDVRNLYGEANANNELQRANAVIAKFISEHALQKWVHHQNVRLGISPATALVIQELPKHGLEGHARSSADSHRGHRSSLQFLRRWRKRWGIRQGKIQIGEDLDSKELLLKVDCSAWLLTVRSRCHLGMKTSFRSE